MRPRLMLKFLLLLLVAMSLAVPLACSSEADARVATARSNCEPQFGEYFGCPVFIRIVKETLILELWVQHKGKWRILKTYPIAGMSGELGPKTAEGDYQAPEGFYDVVPGRMNPRSNYHLSFNIGYPNAYDRSLGRTGSYIMVHGSDVSIGCFAMTDEGIEEIYTLVNEAFRAGQKRVEVHIYPFEMTAERMAKEEKAKSPHLNFWRTLQARWQQTHDQGSPALNPAT